MLMLRGERSTLVTYASNQTMADASAAFGRRLQQRVVLERVGQEAQPQVQPGAGRQQAADLRVGLVSAEARIEVDEDQFGHTQPQRPADFPGDQLGDERLRALAGAGEFHDVERFVVGLDQRWEGAALAQRGDIAGRAHGADHRESAFRSDARSTPGCRKGSHMPAGLVRVKNTAELGQHRRVVGMPRLGRVRRGEQAAPNAFEIELLRVVEVGEPEALPPKELVQRPGIHAPMVHYRDIPGSRS